MEEQKVAEQLYPTEVIDLPSKGIFYSEDSPLRSGQVEIKYMTAKEEDILTSTNLMQKGIILDKLIDSLIVTAGVKSSDLLVGDLDAVMVAARVLGYGKDYVVNMACPKCGREAEHVVDLTTLETINEPTTGDSDTITIILPVSKKEVTIKLLTRADEIAINKEKESLKKSMGTVGESTSRLRAIIQSIDGDTNKGTIWSFVDNMLVRDARFLREAYRNANPGVDFQVPVECECSDEPGMGRLPVGARFFWPDA